MLDSVKEYIKRVMNVEAVDIVQLYYKKKNKWKTVVKLKGYGDITALLKEYPLEYKSGKRKPETTMYLAVDLKGEEITYSLLSVFS